MLNTDHEWIDALILSDEEHHQILEHMSDDTKEACFADLRADDRVAFELPSGAVMKLYHPGGTITTHLIHPRNLSRKGMSFLHGNYVHPINRRGVSADLQEPDGGGGGKHHVVPACAWAGA